MPLLIDSTLKMPRSDLSYVLASELFLVEARLQWKDMKVLRYAGSQEQIAGLSRADTSIWTLGRESQVNLR